VIIQQTKVSDSSRALGALDQARETVNQAAGNGLYFV
jgi:hypothetical protein